MKKICAVPKNRSQPLTLSELQALPEAVSKAASNPSTFLQFKNRFSMERLIQSVQDPNSPKAIDQNSVVSMGLKLYLFLDTESEKNRKEMGERGLVEKMVSSFSKPNLRQDQKSPL